MEENNINYEYLFDDRELDDEIYIEKEDFKPIVSETEKEKIEEKIKELIKNIKIEYE